MRYLPGRSASFIGFLLAVLTFALMLSACPDKKAKYPFCKADKDCEEGETCVNNQCQQCVKHDDCEGGKACEKGACVEKDGFCNGDGDCSDGKICIKNKCTACESDAECGADSHCSNGACIKRGSCRIDEDCADDEDCIDNKCQRPGRDRPPELSCTLETVYFGFDEFSITSGSGDILQKNFDCVGQAPAERGVVLYGHTDPRGTEEYNIALSEKRANAVADYLARLGVDPVRFRVVPKGEAEATGSEESNFDKDRRVEFEWQ